MGALAAFNVGGVLKSLKLTGVAYVADKLRTRLAVTDVDDPVHLAGKTAVVGDGDDGEPRGAVELAKQNEDLRRR